MEVSRKSETKTTRSRYYVALGKFDAYKQTTIFTNGSILDPCMCVYIYNCYGSSQQIFFFFKSQNSKVRLDVIKFIYKNKK